MVSVCNRSATVLRGFSTLSQSDILNMFLYLKGREEEEDDFVPVFTTQVPECEHNRDQNLERSELVKQKMQCAYLHV